MKTTGIRSLGLMLILLSACAGPKMITQTTGNRNQMKFITVQGKDLGVLKCAVAIDGSLTDCREMVLSLKNP